MPRLATREANSQSYNIVHHAAGGGLTILACTAWHGGYQGGLAQPQAWERIVRARKGTCAARAKSLTNVGVSSHSAFILASD